MNPEFATFRNELTGNAESKSAKMQQRQLKSNRKCEPSERLSVVTKLGCLTLSFLVFGEFSSSFFLILSTLDQVLHKRRGRKLIPRSKPRDNVQKKEKVKVEEDEGDCAFFS